MAAGAARRSVTWRRQGTGAERLAQLAYWPGRRRVEADRAAGSPERPTVGLKGEIARQAVDADVPAAGAVW
jgi:hypothetical protein